MKILILGNRGMLGSDLQENLSSANEVIGLDREEVDVTNQSVVEQEITKLSPQVVINATGYTNVDGAEEDRDGAFKLNSDAVGYITGAAAGIQAKMIHFSTEYVFDGVKEQGYDEDSSINPLSVYGESKAAGEKFIINYERGFLVRTSWLYGKSPQRGKPRGMNFVDAIIKAAGEKNEVKVVNDQFGKLTSTKDLSKAVSQLIFGNYKSGIYHLVNEGASTWFDVATEVWSIKKISTPLLPISSADYLMKAKRPKYSVLNNTKFQALRPWPEALAEYLV